MSTANLAQYHRHKCRQVGDDHNYPPQDIYAQQEREAQARRRLNEDLEVVRQAREGRAENEEN